MIPPSGNAWDRLLENATRPFWVGVDLFFVLSGFLITRILVHARGDRHYFRNFYARRTLRIFPLYFASLLLFLVIFPLIPWSGFDAYQSLVSCEKASFWLYYVNYFYAHDVPAGNIGHYWSLCVEEHFYLVWPLVLWLCGGRVLAPALAGIVLTTAFRLGAIETGWWTRELGYHASHLRMDSILTGALAYWLHHRAGGSPRLRTILNGLLPLMLVVCFFTLLLGQVRSSAMGNMIGFPVINLTMGCLLLAVLHRSWRGIPHRILERRFFRGAGKYSYAIYLFHFPLLHLATHLLYPGGKYPAINGMTFPFVLLASAIMLVATVAAAIASWHLFEKRFLALKRYFH